MYSCCASFQKEEGKRQEGNSYFQSLTCKEPPSGPIMRFRRAANGSKCVHTFLRASEKVASLQTKPETPAVHYTAAVPRQEEAQAWLLSLCVRGAAFLIHISDKSTPPSP